MPVNTIQEYGIPKKIDFDGEFAKTGVGKLYKKELRKTSGGR